MKISLKKGDKVTHSIRPVTQTGIGEVYSISERSGRIWVRWEKVVRPTLEVQWQLIKLKEPDILLKEIL